MVICEENELIIQCSCKGCGFIQILEVGNRFFIDYFASERRQLPNSKKWSTQIEIPESKLAAILDIKNDSLPVLLKNKSPLLKRKGVQYFYFPSDDGLDSIQVFTKLNKRPIFEIIVDRSEIFQALGDFLEVKDEKKNSSKVSKRKAKNNRNQ